MILTIIVFILILGILVLAHELGHFITARIFKTRVDEFGMGFPPRMFGIYKDENGKRKLVWGRKFKSEDAPNTVYSLNWFPIGGFVKIKGENESELKEPDSFASKKIWQRTVILATGVTMNVILCVILLSIGFGFGIPSVLDDEVLAKATSVRNEKIQVVSVSKDSPAALAGLKIGDSLISLDGNQISSTQFVQDYVHPRGNQVINLELIRGTDSMSFEITPQVLATSSGQSELGVGLVRSGVVTYPWYLSFWQGIKATYYLIIAMFVALWGVIQTIFGIGEMTAEIAGPVGIAVLTGQVVDMGLVYVLQFAALLSINLALINILPIPALDGGRILFLIIEKIRGRVVNQKIEALIHNIGFALLMVLIVFVTYKDIARWGGQFFERVF